MQKRLVLGCLIRRAHVPLVRELATTCVPLLSIAAGQACLTKPQTDVSEVKLDGGTGP